jgi:hypothetical protein
MWDRVLQTLMLIMISFALVFSPVAQSAEFMESGSVLVEDSMVFSIEEADALRIRIEGLENTELKVEALTELVDVQEREIVTLEELLEIKDYQIDEWQDLSQTHQDRVEKMERREKFNTLENVGWLILGVAVTGGAIYLGDQIGDSMENN